jgi:hypothetical protein
MLDRDVGWYEAVARNEHGEARQRVRLEIAEFPEFIRRPEIQYVMHRGKGRFDARIVGVPYPEIKWFKDWKPLATSTRIKVKEEFIFVQLDPAVSSRSNSSNPTPPFWSSTTSSAKMRVCTR